MSERSPELQQSLDRLAVFQETSRLLLDLAINMGFVADGLSYTMPEAEPVAVLYKLAKLARNQAKELDQAVSEESRAQLQQAKESSATMLKACLAGVFVASEGKQAADAGKTA